ncbi:nucleoside hydrolase [Amnibacterium sp. CER49]|uniref:nucleoside hydrolase n=1 Tax=Amnibacterium sp. CER49 TaxID=3039161 RepID=UPI0024479C53|nr:nucleoside hydrolase [Amnibacterium sp. CER49]MDH2443166.1 nucleoside hydrolase [Amnibacterium sp. CER49]
MSGLRVAERCRVIVDNDWAGDPDGLVALAHHLLSPANRVELVTSSFLDPVFESPGGAARGAALAEELIDLIGKDRRPPVVAGSEQALTHASSPAAEAIVAAARRDDPLPLLLVCAGPLTNVAEALRLAADIATRLTLVWIGGAAEDRGFEYNRDTDPAAAELVFAVPELAIRWFPLETYERCAYSIAELEHDLRRSGRIGEWLWERFVTLPLPEGFPVGATWTLGDSPPLLVTALTDASSSSVLESTGAAERRRYTDVDLRLLVGDLLARLRLHEQGRDRSAR